VGELGGVAPAVAAAVLYAGVLAHAGSRAAGPSGEITRARLVAGIAGFVALVVALGPPLDVWATSDLVAHMTQHVLLLSIAPPLLIVGLVPSVVTGVFSPEFRSRAARAVDPGLRVLRRTPVFVVTAVAVALQSLALLLWHLPVLYDAAVGNDAIHAAEHLTFLGTGLLFWWTVAGAGRRAGTAAAVLTIFVASLPMTLLGALMTLSTSPWYPTYATHSFAASLQSQQLAGVVMWAFGGFVYVLAGAVLFLAWMRELERASPSRAGLEPVR
jgi:putative membrane protein